MGFEETNRNEIGMVFFRCEPDRHVVGFKADEAGQLQEHDEALKVEHLALKVDTIDIFFQARDLLEENKRPIVFQGRKGAGGNRASHLCDPDGHDFELYDGMDQISDNCKLRLSDQFHRVVTLEAARDKPLHQKW